MTDLLTAPEVAQKVRVSARTVSNWLKRGLPHFKLGRTVRVSPADLEIWINRHKRVEFSPLTPALVEVLHGEPQKVEFSVPRCRKPKAISSVF